MLDLSCGTLNPDGFQLGFLLPNLFNKFDFGGDNLLRRALVNLDLFFSFFGGLLDFFGFFSTFDVYGRSFLPSCFGVFLGRRASFDTAFLRNLSLIKSSEVTIVVVTSYLDGTVKSMSQKARAIIEPYPIEFPYL